MGSWDVTCMASRVGISAGEECVALWLVENVYSSFYGYNTGFWAPLPFLTYGTYNDYGALEDVHGRELDDLIAYVKTHLFEVPKGENPYHDIPVTPDLITPDYMYEADHEGRLFLKPPPWYTHHRKKAGEPVYDRARLKVALIRKSLLDQVLANYPLDEYNLKKHDYDYTPFNQMVRKLSGEIKGFKADVTDDFSDLTEEQRRIQLVLQDFKLRDGEAISWEDRDKYPALYHINCYLRDDGKYALPSEPKFMRKITEKSMREFRLDCIEKLKWAWLMRFLGVGRINFCPNSTGPQFAGDSFYTNLFLANYITTEIAKCKKEWEE